MRAIFGLTSAAIYQPTSVSQSKFTLTNLKLFTLFRSTEIPNTSFTKERRKSPCRTGGNDCEALTNRLPQKDCYVNVLRDEMATDSLDECRICFVTTGAGIDIDDTLLAKRERIKKHGQKTVLSAMEAKRYRTHQAICCAHCCSDDQNLTEAT